MPADGTTRRAQDREGKPMHREAIPKIACEIARLAPGPAAALRLGPYEGGGAAAFWKLLAEHLPADGPVNEGRWAALIHAMAVLTPRGRNPDKKSAHNPAVPMGTALHVAGVSEQRLARLLATPARQRPSAATRICRRLAAGKGENGKGFDLITLGEFILFGTERTKYRIARDYYYRAKAQGKEQDTDA